MITKEELLDKYSRYTTSELLEVIEHKHNYTDLAVVTAIEEIGRRKVTEDEIASHKLAQSKSQVENVKRNYVDRLSVWQKHFFFFIWIPILTFPFKRNFVEDGYQMKLKQARYFSLLGFISILVATFLSIQFAFTKYSFWLIVILEFGATLVFDGVFNPVYHLVDQEELENTEEELK
jgi:hypothetical protein